jgi:hypothetical protein
MAQPTDGGRDFSTDRSKFFGSSRCASSGLVLCDGFETGTLDTQTWTKAGNGTITIDAMHAARGTNALHVRSVDNGWAIIRESKTFPAPGNRYFGRMFVWFSLLPVAPNWAHWNIAEAEGTGSTELGRIGGQWDPGFDGKTPQNYFGQGSGPGPTGDWTNQDQDPGGKPTAVPTGSWICVEWMHDGDANQTRFFWDGTEHASLYTDATHHGGNQSVMYDLPAFTSVYFGFWFYQGNGQGQVFDTWIDEVAIDYQRIGCVQ